MRKLFFPAFLAVALYTAPASPHVFTTADEHRSYDYTVLLRNTNCCGGRECRPAYSYAEGNGVWDMIVPKDGLDPHSPSVHIVVPKQSATIRDLAGDGIAHACGYFSDDSGEWVAGCTFIPPSLTQRLFQRLKDVLAFL